MRRAASCRLISEVQWISSKTNWIGSLLPSRLSMMLPFSSTMMEGVDGPVECSSNCKHTKSFNISTFYVVCANDANAKI